MKKLALLFAVLALVLCLFAGCGTAEDEVPDDTNVSTTDDGRVNGDNDTTESAGDMIEDAADATGDMIDDAADGAEAALDPTNGNPKPDTGTEAGNAQTNNSDEGNAGSQDGAQRSRIIRGTGTPDMVTGREPAEGRQDQTATRK